MMMRIKLVFAVLLALFAQGGLAQTALTASCTQLTSTQAPGSIPCTMTYSGTAPTSYSWSLQTPDAACSFSGAVQSPQLTCIYGGARRPCVTVQPSGSSVCALATYAWRYLRPSWGTEIAADYTVCPSGCTHTTIQSAYTAALCGQIVEVRINGGIDELLTLSKTCSAGSPITIRAGSGYTPRIDTTTVAWSSPLTISGTYNVWDGIGIYDHAHGDGIILSGNNNTIKNMTMDRISYIDWPAGANAAGILVRSSGNTIQNNTMLAIDHECIRLDGMGFTTERNQILNNTLRTQFGQGISILGSGAQYNLADGNDISLSGDSCVGSGCASKAGIQISGGRNNSFRRNVFHDLYNRAVELSSYSAATQQTLNNWFYNNTFYNITTRTTSTDTVAWVFTGNAVPGTTLTGNRFVNNIADKIAQQINTGAWNTYAGYLLYFGYENDLGDTEAALFAGQWGGNMLINNIIRPYYSGSYQVANANTVFYTNAGGSYHTGWTVSSVNGNGGMAGNITADPLFTSTDTSVANWWRPQAGSPAINGGVVVTDPNASAGGWAQLSYIGSAPDIGAYEQ